MTILEKLNDINQIIYELDITQQATTKEEFSGLMIVQTYLLNTIEEIKNELKSTSNCQCKS